MSQERGAGSAEWERQHSALPPPRSAPTAEYPVTFNQARRQVLSAASFDPDAYEQLRDDPAATVYAVGVVVVATLLAALGGLLWARFAASPPPIFETDTGRFFTRS